MKKTLIALAAVALLGAACGTDEPAAPNDAAAAKTKTTPSKAVRFAECMRDNGVTEFPDPDASGELTIDGVLNGSSINAESPTWKQAIETCKDLQPSGFTGDKHVTDEQQEARLRFADCIRRSGVPDFPDPVKGEPLVNTNKIPSAATESGMTALNAAMKKCGDIAEEAMGRNR